MSAVNELSKGVEGPAFVWLGLDGSAPDGLFAKLRYDVVSGWWKVIVSAPWRQRGGTAMRATQDGARVSAEALAAKIRRRIK